MNEVFISPETFRRSFKTRLDHTLPGSLTLRRGVGVEAWLGAHDKLKLGRVPSPWESYSVGYRYRSRELRDMVEPQIHRLRGFNCQSERPIPRLIT